MGPLQFILSNLLTRHKFKGAKIPQLRFTFVDCVPVCYCESNHRSIDGWFKLLVIPKCDIIRVYRGGKVFLYGNIFLPLCLLTTVFL
jgi:hypothetical protein